MLSDPLERLVLLFAVGVGFALVGGVNYCLACRHPRIRVGTTAFILACVLVGTAAWCKDAVPLSQLALLLLGGIAACALLTSSWVLLLCGQATASLSRPGGCWLTLGVCGLILLLLASGFQNNTETELQMLTALAHEREVYKPSLASTDAVATTDQGTPIPLKASVSPRSGAEAERPEMLFLDKSPFRDQLIRRGAAYDHANCHGWVFTAGRYWLAGDYVASILEENGYRSVGSPRPGDLVVYRDKGTASHSAVVRYVTRGMPVLVEGKWGPFGVYLHPVEQSSYGTNFSYYRSRRTGHLLRGVLETGQNPVRLEAGAQKETTPDVVMN